jgi:hypothetical protein
MIPRPLWIAILVCAMVAADLLVPVLWGTVPEGLAVVEAHKGAPDPPNPDPPKDPPKPDPRPEPQRGLEITSGYWYVVRATRPTEPVYGPFVFDEPQCRGYTRRYPFYRCVKLP